MRVYTYGMPTTVRLSPELKGYLNNPFPLRSAWQEIIDDAVWQIRSELQVDLQRVDSRGNIRLFSTARLRTTDKGGKVRKLDGRCRWKGASAWIALSDEAVRGEYAYRLSLTKHEIGHFILKVDGHPAEKDLDTIMYPDLLRQGETEYRPEFGDWDRARALALRTGRVRKVG